MPTWSDDFQRPDGPLGANWHIFTGVPSIVGGVVKCTPTTYAHVQVVDQAGPHDASVTYLNQVSADLGVGPTVKVADAGNTFYRAYVSGAAGSYTATIAKYSPAITNIATAMFSYVLPATVTVRLVYNSGDLWMYVDGVLRCWAFDNTFDAANRMGFFSPNANTGITLFGIDSGSLTAFQVTPNTAVSNGPPITVTMTGTGTAWTPGTPGSPTFTASAGTFTDQNVLAADLAYVTFTPPATEQSVIVTDPSTALTDTIYCSPEGTTPPPPGFAPKLTDEGAATLNRAAVIPGDQTVTTDLSIIIPGALGQPDLTMLNAIAQIWYAHYATWAGGPPDNANAVGRVIWRILAGYWEPAEFVFEPLTTTPIKSDTELTLAQFWDPVEAVYVTTPQLLAAIDAITVPDLSGLEADIGIHGQGTWTSILQVLLGMWGPGAHTLTTIGDDVDAIRGLAGLTLADILDAINALPPADLQAVLDRIDQVQPDLGIDLTTLDAKINHVDATADALSTSLAAMRTGSNLTLQDILDAIAAIPPPAPGGDYLGAPVWPGLAGATLGASVPLSDGLVVSGPLHGLLFQVTSQPGNAIGYPFGAVMSWSHVGQVVFASDRGDYERAQSFAIDAHLICPKEMRVAASATIRLNNNWGGTVRPFTIT